MNRHSVSGEKIRSLLRGAGFPDSYTLECIPAGGNNRVYKLDCENGEKYLLKEYFIDKEDPRNRLKTEFTFLSFLWRHGIRTIPEPITLSSSDNLGLFRFIPGRSLTREDVTEDRVRELLSFFSTINQLRTKPKAAELPCASDACFSVQEHLDHIQGRIDRLSTIQIQSDNDLQALEFILNTLIPGWLRISRNINRICRERGTLCAQFPGDIRVLSPSDFGFHNTILGTDGSLMFIDFEYAGWDEPIKMICDLFCQPKVPIDLKFFESVASSIINASEGDANQCMIWTDLLFPAYQIKWCCIILNDFLPVGGNRRVFADSNRSSKERKFSQLHKAQELFHTINH